MPTPHLVRCPLIQRQEFRHFGFGKLFTRNLQAIFQACEQSTKFSLVVCCLKLALCGVLKREHLRHPAKDRPVAYLFVLDEPKERGAVNF